MLRPQCQHRGIVFRCRCFALLQIRCQCCLLTGELAPLPGQCFQVLPAVDMALLGPPLQAQCRKCLSGQALALRCLDQFLHSLGIGFCQRSGVDQPILGDAQVAEVGNVVLQLLQGQLLGSQVCLQLLALFKLLAPAAQPLAQCPALGVRRAEVRVLLAFFFCARQRVLSPGRQAAGQRLGAVLLLVMRHRCVMAFFLQSCQHGIAIFTSCLRLLHVVVQRLERLRGLAIGKALQPRCGAFKRCRCIAARGLGGLHIKRALRQIYLPLALCQSGLMGGLHVGQFIAPTVHIALHRGALWQRQQLHAVGAGFELLQLLPGLTRLFKHPHRDVAVDFRAGQLLQQFGPVVGAGVQKSGKAALGQQHGFGETRKIEPGDVGNALEFVVTLTAQNGACATGAVHTGQFDPWRLQRTVDFVAGAALAPEGAVHSTFHFKRHFGQAVHRVARHDVVRRSRDAFQARCLVIQREADGIEQRGFASAGRASDRKQAVVTKRRLGEVDGPLAFQRVEVFQTQAQNFHAAPSARLVTTAR